MEGGGQGISDIQFQLKTRQDSSFPTQKDSGKTPQKHPGSPRTGQARMVRHHCKARACQSWILGPTQARTSGLEWFLAPPTGPSASASALNFSSMKHPLCAGHLGPAEDSQLSLPSCDFINTWKNRVSRSETGPISVSQPRHHWCGAPSRSSAHRMPAVTPKPVSSCCQASPACSRVRHCQSCLILASHKGEKLTHGGLVIP